jgi:hypothetical protein
MVHRKEGLDVLFFSAKEALLSVWRHLGKGMPGIIAVMHTFGGDLKWNPHVHCIVTCGGLNGKQWKWVNFIPFRRLRMAWKIQVIRGVRRWGKRQYQGKEYTRFNAWLNFLYQKEWYVHVGKRLKSLEFTVKYVGRYAKKPVIAETRLKGFDGEMVTFTHRDKVLQREVEICLPVMEFIGKLVRHIPDKHHRMIRYSGLFANRTKKEKLALVRAAIGDGCLPVWTTRPLRTWRERVQEWTGVDPYQCSCGKIMRLVVLVVRVRSGEMVAIRAPP